MGIAPYETPSICILTVIDDPEDRFTGGSAAAPVFSKIIDRILPYLGSAKTPGSMKIRKTKVEAGTLEKWPDFTGMTMAQVRDVLLRAQNRKNISYTIRGKGQVFRQSLRPGKKINDNDGIILYMK